MKFSEKAIRKQIETNERSINDLRERNKTLEAGSIELEENLKLLFALIGLNKEHKQELTRDIIETDEWLELSVDTKIRIIKFVASCYDDRDSQIQALNIVKRVLTIIEEEKNDE